MMQCCGVRKSKTSHSEKREGSAHICVMQVHDNTAKFSVGSFNGVSAPLMNCVVHGWSDPYMMRNKTFSPPFAY